MPATRANSVKSVEHPSPSQLPPGHVKHVVKRIIKVIFAQDAAQNAHEFEGGKV